ncbi:MAG: isocitrate lyase/phosphoenolpyruvate mutase family protein [Verrucomicrobiota bacterium]|jgi:2-methylisocitrate lyase-like PEP mutase family enzyme
MTPIEKAKRFRELHERAGVLLIPNPWDGGSARMLQSLGFEALATSSGACAGTYGRVDGRLKREESLASARQIVSATELPVSADLEGGFGAEPEAAFETVRQALASGLAGCSIEDFTGDTTRPIFELTQARARIAAAAEAARSTGSAFVLTARSDNFLRGVIDLKNAIVRLNAYSDAGADVLFAPCLPDIEAVREVCRSVNKPVNFMVGIKGKSFSVEELSEAGVKRISFASSLFRAAMTGALQAAREIKEHGTFRYLDTVITTPDWNAMMTKG